MSNEKCPASIRVTFKMQVEAFEKRELPRLYYATREIKTAMLFQYVFHPLVLQKWDNDSLVHLYSLVRSHYQETSNESGS